MPGARYSLGSFPEGAVSPFGAHADGETEGVALILVSLFPPTAVLFLRPVSCSFLSEITKLSLLRKRGEGTEKSFDLPWRGETDQIKNSSLSSRKRKGARSNKKRLSFTKKKGSPRKQKAPFFNRKRGEPAQTKSALPQCKRRGVRLNKTTPFLNAKGGELKQKNSSSARPHGGGFICQNSVVTGAGRFGTSRLELNVESNFRCDQMGRSLKSRSSDQLCAPSVKLYVGLSSLSEIFLASWGMKLIISSVPPDMRFSRRRFLRFSGQPAFPACPYHLGHMVIGVALADSISAFEVIALIVHWSFLPCEIALKLQRFTCTLE